METATRVPRADQSLSTGKAFLTAVLPGKLEPRIRAAASLPAWMVISLAACLLIVNMELFVSTGNVISDYLETALPWAYRTSTVAPPPPAFGAYMHKAWAAMKLHVLPELLGDLHRVPLLGLLMGIFLGILELVSVLLVGPFGTSFGQRFWEAQRRVWRVVFLLGSLWLLQAIMAWTLVCVFGGATAAWLISSEQSSDYVRLTLSFGFGVALCLLLLQVWLIRLIRACGRLATTPEEAPAARCGHCGYFLEGLAEGNSCPECGQTDPAGLDRTREPTLWTACRRANRFDALKRLAVQVLVAPGRLFGRMRVLSDAQDSRRFLLAAICAGLIPWIIAVPGMLRGFAGHSGVDSKVVWVTLLISPMFVLLSSLAGIVIICLLISLVGLLAGRARQEPAWSIAVNAGCYLTGLFPWIIMAQSLWINVFHGLIGYERMEKYSRGLAGQFHMPWPILFVLILLIPTILGIGLAIRTAVVCYRHVRYACR